MDNTKKLYEIDITNKDEQYLLTKQMRSPLVRSDIFALAGYKRSTISLIGGEDIVLNSAKMFFECELTKDSVVIYQGADAICNLQTHQIDYTEKVVEQKSWWNKVVEFFKGSELSADTSPSKSCIVVKTGDQYQFVGAISENSGVVSFSLDPLSKQIVAVLENKSSGATANMELFDIVEIHGTKSEIITNFFELRKTLYKSAPRVSSPVNTLDIPITEGASKKTAEILSSLESFTFANITLENDPSLMVYVETAKQMMKIFTGNIKENIFPIASFSPYICMLGSPEHKIFASAILKKPNGKPYKYTWKNSEYFILNPFDTAYSRYLQKHIASLFEMGFYGVRFENLDALNFAKAPNCTTAFTIETAYSTLSNFTNGKISIAKGCNQSFAIGKIDFIYVGSDCKQEPDATTKTVTKLKNQDLSETKPATGKWDFSGFENAIKYLESNREYNSFASVSVDCELLNQNTQAFDLCTICNMFIFKNYNLKNPTLSAVSRAVEFEFLKNVEVSEIMKLDDLRYAVVFFLEEIANVCFFNFSTEVWEIEGNVIPPLSAEFKAE